MPDSIDNPDQRTVDVRGEVNTHLAALLDLPTQLTELLAPQLIGCDPDARNAMLTLALHRDDGRCGLCATRLDVSVAGQVHLDHIVPVHLTGFDIDNGEAVPGRGWRSVGSRIGNLQAAHASCDRRRGDSLHLRRWRHPRMMPTPVAQNAAGQALTLPAR